MQSHTRKRGTVRLIFLLHGSLLATSRLGILLVRLLLLGSARLLLGRGGSASGRLALLRGGFRSALITRSLGGSRLALLVGLEQPLVALLTVELLATELFL